MKQAVDFWIFSYRERYFVRWVISDKSKKEVIGTIELFHRDSVIDAFDKACEGKTADEIAALVNNSGESYGYAVDDVYKAGCTIYAGTIVKAAVKAAKAN